MVMVMVMDMDARVLGYYKIMPRMNWRWLGLWNGRVFRGEDGRRRGGGL